MSDLYVCRRRLDASGPRNKGRILVRKARPGEPGARSLQEAFRQAKKVAGWRREIPKEPAS